MFAIEAIAAAEATLIDLENPALGGIKIRVGMHTGPVVTNVVGTKNPRCKSEFGLRSRKEKRMVTGLREG